LRILLILNDYLIQIYYLVSDLFIKIMTVIIVKEDFYTIYPNGSPSKWAFELLVERINRYVERDSEGEFALLVMDSVVECVYGFLW